MVLCSPREIRSFQPSANFLGVLATVKGGDPEITFAFRSKPAPWSDDDIQLLQHAIEHFPTGETRRSFHPN